MKKILFTACASLLSLSLFAQSNSKQEAIESSLRSIDRLMASKSVFRSLDIAPDLSSIDVEDINNWANDLQESEFAKSGLELSGGYDYRFWDDTFVDDDYSDGEATPYKHRFLVSLTWNLMQSGIVGRENFSQKVDILARTKSQQMANNAIKSFVVETSEQQIANLYGYYNVLIDAKAELYSELIAMQEQLAAGNKATALSLSDLKIKRSNALRMRKSGVAQVSGLIDLDRYVASHRAMHNGEYDALVESNNSIARNKLEQELILNEADGISYWRDVKVSPFMRIYNYLDESTNSKFAGKLGVTASFPIFTNTKAKRKEVASRGKLLANEEQLIRSDIAYELSSLTQQLNENLVTLNILVEGSQYYSESCSLARQYYDNKRVTIQELSQRYIDSLDNNIEIYNLIIEREKLKRALFEIIYGV